MHVACGLFQLAMNLRKSSEREKIVQSEICPFFLRLSHSESSQFHCAETTIFSCIWVNHRFIRFSRHSSFWKSTSELEVSESYTILSLEPRARSCTSDTQSHCSVQWYLFTFVAGLILPPACEILNRINTLAKHSAHTAYQRYKTFRNTKMQIYLRIFLWSAKFLESERR